MGRYLKKRQKEEEEEEDETITVYLMRDDTIDQVLKYWEEGRKERKKTRRQATTAVLESNLVSIPIIIIMKINLHVSICLSPSLSVSDNASTPQHSMT